jgi:hypothetical protein
MDELEYFRQMDAATLVHGALFMMLWVRHRLLGRHAALRLTPVRDWPAYRARK